MTSDPTFPAETFSPEAYTAQTAALLALPLAGEYRPGVAANVARLYAVAAPLLDFPLPPELDAAPVFEP